MVQYFGITNLNFWQLIPIGCVVPVGFHYQLVFKTASALVSIVTLFGIAMAFRKSRPNVHERCLEGALTILYLMQSTIILDTFSTFLCETFDDNSRRLKVDYSIDCDSDWHRIMELYAAAMIVIFPVGTPVS